jgi:glycogen debranching enzyme
MFISLPGACLVTGQFDVARKILQSFAEFQNTDTQSSHYGRVPNRLRPDDVIYNTTDGTPRFVIALLDYINYSGDLSLVNELYPAVRRSLDGPIEHWVDNAGYLTHDDADTWMDAKLDGTVPWSPRGNRANDIQALWYHQLLAGAYFARLLNEVDDAQKWQALADRLRANFLIDFFDTTETQFMADRLHPDGVPDFTVRPNQLFALDLIPDEPTRWRITRSVWEELVYPWGVASLSQYDENFHPYHENWEYYHKDAAYHNGTVWIWNNGIAMQRMLEAEQTEPAYELLENMSRLALYGGAVGSLCENMDALPRQGSSWPRRSGTFLQAWSNAEYLRVWYQYFLGVQPRALDNGLAIAPLIPDSVSELAFRIRLFMGSLEGRYHRAESTARYEYVFTEVAPRVRFTLPIYGDVEVSVTPGDRLAAKATADSLIIELRDATGTGKLNRRVLPDPERVERFRNLQDAFQGVRFAIPYLQPNLKALEKKRGEGAQ